MAVEPEHYSATVYWGSVDRGRAIIQWVNETCPSYICLYHKHINFKGPLSLENANMELWFSNESEAMLCALKWR